MDIMDSCRDCVFITHTGEGYARARTMNKLQDNDRSGGIMWFATDRKSRKAKEIKANPRTTLFFTHAGTHDHVCVFGVSAIAAEPEVKERFWKDEWSRYWKGGPQDPDYVLVKFIPEKGEFFFNEEAQTGVIDFKAGREAG